MRIVPSMNPAATWLPTTAGDQATTYAKSSSPPGKSRSREPVRGSQIFTERSREAEANRSPSGAQFAEYTRSVCPVKFRNSAPVAGFHSLSERSNAPETIAAPSGDHATARTHSVWPTRVWRSSPVAAFQIRTVLSEDAEAIPWTSPDQASDQIGAG